ncbi:MAG TPA: hypothetical protein VD994_13310 [Prosthecobacter sp.]|nr:hypothetical protein [Prosthecobacter sp.]
MKSIVFLSALTLSLSLISCDKQSRDNANKNPAARAAQGAASVPPGSDPKAAEGPMSLGSPGGAPGSAPGTTNPAGAQPPSNPAAANTPAGNNPQ